MKLLLSTCLTLPLVACGASEPASVTVAGVTPDLVDLEQLNERLQPTGGERALLVNFWATW